MTTSSSQTHTATSTLTAESWPNGAWGSQVLGTQFKRLESLDILEFLLEIFKIMEMLHMKWANTPRPLQQITTNLPAVYGDDNTADSPDGQSKGLAMFRSDSASISWSRLYTLLSNFQISWFSDSDYIVLNQGSHQHQYHYYEIQYHLFLQWVPGGPCNTGAFPPMGKGWADLIGNSAWRTCKYQLNYCSIWVLSDVEATPSR